MPLSYQVTGAAKNNLLVSLAAILLSDSNLDISQENIDSVVTASGNTIPSYYSALYANYIEKAGGVERFLAGPSAGGGTCFTANALVIYCCWPCSYISLCQCDQYVFFRLR